MEIWDIIVSCISLAAILTSFLTLIITYWQRSEQPFKCKTPFLVVITCFFGFLIGIATFLLYESNFNFFTHLRKYSVYLLDCVAFGLVFMPFVMRSWLLIEIFSVSQVDIENKTEGSRMPRMALRKIQFSLICITTILFFLIYYLGFNYTANSEHLLENRNVFNYFVFFVSELTLAISLIFLMGIDSDINMKYELVFCLLTFFAADIYAFIYKQMHEGIIFEEMVERVEAFCLNIRIFLLVFSTLTSCIIKHFHHSIIPYGECLECSKSLEKVLASRISIICFHNYLEDSSDSEGNIMLEFYELIKIFEDEIDKIQIEASSSSESSRLEAFNLASEIMNNYINSIEFLTKNIPQDVVLAIKRKMESQNIDKHLFDSVYGIVMNRLQKSYNEFTNSPHFNQLQIDLLKNEIIYEREHRSNLL